MEWGGRGEEVGREGGGGGEGGGMRGEEEGEGMEGSVCTSPFNLSIHIVSQDPEYWRPTTLIIYATVLGSRKLSLCCLSKCSFTATSSMHNNESG